MKRHSDDVFFVDENGEFCPMKAPDLHILRSLLSAFHTGIGTRPLLEVEQMTIDEVNIHFNYFFHDECDNSYLEKYHRNHSFKVDRITIASFEDRCKMFEECLYHRVLAVLGMENLVSFDSQEEITEEKEIEECMQVQQTLLKVVELEKERVILPDGKINESVEKSLFEFAGACARSPAVKYMQAVYYYNLDSEIVCDKRDIMFRGCKFRVSSLRPLSRIAVNYDLLVLIAERMDMYAVSKFRYVNKNMYRYYLLRLKRESGDSSKVMRIVINNMITRALDRYEYEATVNRPKIEEFYYLGVDVDSVSQVRRRVGYITMSHMGGLQCAKHNVVMCRYCEGGYSVAEYRDMDVSYLYAGIHHAGEIAKMLREFDPAVHNLMLYRIRKMSMIEVISYIILSGRRMRVNGEMFSSFCYQYDHLVVTGMMMLRSGVARHVKEVVGMMILSGKNNDFIEEFGWADLRKEGWTRELVKRNPVGFKKRIGARISARVNDRKDPTNRGWWRMNESRIAYE